MANRKSKSVASEPKPAARKSARSGKPRAGKGRPVNGARTARLEGSDDPAAQQLPPAFPVIGIGASAGGLEACAQILEPLPADFGAAIIIVQHLAPTHDSALAQLLGVNSRLPVVQVKDGMRIEPNCVYVIPPDKQMGLADGKLELTPRPHDNTRHRAIDFFFRTLAAYAQSKAIGIVVSGTDSDGTIGIREIKGMGGITIAQEPSTARYDGMPRSAIATGTVDLVLSPADIAHELVRLARHPFLADLKSAVLDHDHLHADDHLARIFAVLRNSSGVDFTHYKQPTIKRRLQRRMVLHKISSLEQYVRYLQQNPGEARALYQDLLIHVTRFFRNPEAFEALESRVYPKITAGRGHDDPVRVWVPGCSTGEEAYSVAISLLEFLGERTGSLPVQIFATDVSETAIDHARAATYPESISADVSQERLRRFFVHSDGNYRVNKSVRDLCIFARQDLTRDPPFSRLDLIVCRNVLIYLGPLLQRKLMNVFHYALKPDGFLLLGSAETVGGHADLFEVRDKRHRLYSKKEATTGDLRFTPVDYTHERATPARRSGIELRRPNTVQNEANRILLLRYAPPGVIVDDNLRIVQFRGQTGPFLEPAPGEASLNLLKMTREGLLHGLRTALKEARRTRQSARRTGLKLKYNGNTREVNLEVVPIEGVAEGRHFLVIFENGTEIPTAHAPPSRAKETKALPDDQRLTRLQDELASSREFLQSTIQDLEATNEELQSANEEVLSANEELQSTNEELDTAKEELQSTNEELNTVNEELQARNEELGRVNSDLINLLGSVQIAIVMVSGDLRIRRFTPTAEKVLNLIPTDVGRPISDIKPNIDCADLEQLITDTVESVTPRERQVKDRMGHWYSLRIRPYKNVENRIDGAVLALFEMHDRAPDKTPPADQTADSPLRTDRGTSGASKKS